MNENNLVICVRNIVSHGTTLLIREYKLGLIVVWIFSIKANYERSNTKFWSYSQGGCHAAPLGIIALFIGIGVYGFVSLIMINSDAFTSMERLLLIGFPDLIPCARVIRIRLDGQ